MAHVATQEVFAHRKATIVKAPAATPARTLLLDAGKPVVTLTDTKGVARPDKNIKVGNLTVSGFVAPGVGNEEAEAVIGEFAVGAALDGTWEFEDIVSSGTTAVPTTTPQRTPVFLTSAGALTLAASGNTRVGVVDYPASYVKVAGTLPVAIGE
jgi:hypothetical protein